MEWRRDDRELRVLSDRERRSVRDERVAERSGFGKAVVRGICGGGGGGGGRSGTEWKKKLGARLGF